MTAAVEVPASDPSPNAGGTLSSGSAHAAWVGASFAVLAVAWIPGLDAANSLRTWLLTGALPLALVVRASPSAVWHAASRPGRVALVAWALVFAVLVVHLAAAFLVSEPTRFPGAVAARGLHWLGLGAALAYGLLAGAPPPAEAGNRGRGRIDATRHLLVSVAGSGLAITVWLPGTPPGGTIGNVDLTAGCLALTAIWSAFALFLPPRSSAEVPAWARPHWLRAIALAGLALQLVTLVVLGSLGGLLALAAAALASALWAGVRALVRGGVSPRSSNDSAGGLRRWTPSISALGIRRMVGLAVLAIAAVVPVALEADTIDDHLRGRGFMAARSVTLVADAPWLGHGAGDFRRAWLHAQAAWLADGTQGGGLEGDRDLWTLADHAHNEALQVAAELGVPVAAIACLPWLLALVWRPRVDAAWASVVGLGVVSTVSLPLHEPCTAFLACASIGLCLARRVRTGEPVGENTPSEELAPVERTGASSGEGQDGSTLPGVRVALVAVCGAALLAASADLVSKRLLVRGASAKDAATLELASTLALRPARAEAHLAAALHDDSVAAERWARRAVGREPSPRGWAQVGRLAAFNDDPEGAAAAYERAVGLHPRFFAGWVNLSLVRTALGDHGGARRAAVRARSLRPHDPRLSRLPH